MQINGFGLELSDWKIQSIVFSKIIGVVAGFCEKKTTMSTASAGLFQIF